MKYDLIISDYDGTLGDYNGIKEETITAINNFIKKGGKFCVCTGRPFQSIKQILSRYKIEEGLVGCLQGSEVCDLKTGEELYKLPIDRKVACQIVLDMEKDKMIPTVWTKEALYYKEPNPYEHRYLDLHCIPVIRVDDLEKEIENKQLEVLKIAAVCKDEIIDKKRDIYNKKYGKFAVFNSGAKDVFETVNVNSTKATDVVIIAKKYNIPLQKVMTVGDSTNDIEMVSGSWHGVAVGDGKEELKKSAKEITVNFENQPIKYLIEKYCLKD